jgi:hypothetical protein
VFLSSTVLHSLNGGRRTLESSTFRFIGPQGGPRKYGTNKGVMREYRERKRREAQDRQKRYTDKQAELRQSTPLS